MGDGHKSKVCMKRSAAFWFGFRPGGALEPAETKEGPGGIEPWNGECTAVDAGLRSPCGEPIVISIGTELGAGAAPLPSAPP
jgi:hypothetical protein